MRTPNIKYSRSGMSARAESALVPVGTDPDDAMWCDGQGSQSIIHGGQLTSESINHQFGSNLAFVRLTDIAVFLLSAAFILLYDVFFILYLSTILHLLYQYQSQPFCWVGSLWWTWIRSNAALLPAQLYLVCSEISFSHSIAEYLCPSTCRWFKASLLIAVA